MIAMVAKRLRLFWILVLSIGLGVCEKQVLAGAEKKGLEVNRRVDEQTRAVLILARL